MDKVMIANLPTKIEKVHFFSKDFDKSVFIKRDDQTGMATSGNKLRKLEYLLNDAQKKMRLFNYKWQDSIKPC